MTDLLVNKQQTLLCVESASHKSASVNLTWNKVAIAIGIVAVGLLFFNPLTVLVVVGVLYLIGTLKDRKWNILTQCVETHPTRQHNATNRAALVASRDLT